MTRRLAAVAVLLFALLPATAMAHWGTSGSGTGSAGAATLSVPAVTAPASAGAGVALSWTAARLAPANATLDAQVTYAVQRSADGGATWSAAAGTCTGTLTAAMTSCSDAPPTSGSYVYRVTASMRTWTATGTSGTVTANVLVAPSLTAKPSSPSANAAPSFAFSGGSGTGYECRLDGAAYASCASPVAYSALAGGSHTFSVRAVQGAFTGPAATSTWTIDTSAPALGAKPASPSANASGATIAFSDASHARFECKLDAGAFTTCSSPQALTALNGGASLAAGSHTFTVRALDADGVATTTAAYTWTVNTSAPTFSSTPPNPSTTASATFAFGHTIYTGFQCQLDAGGFSACTSPKTYTALAAGSHTVQVRALDADGIATPAAIYTWTITAPVVAITSCTGGNGHRNAIQGTTTDNGGTLTVRIYAGTGTGGALAATLTTTTFTGSASPYSWSVSSANGQLTAGATYTAQATQVSAGGTASNAATCTFSAN